jgi:hypothetical protein
MDTAGEGLRRRRGGGREGHARSALPEQRPWAQPRLRFGPTEIVSADELEAIHLGSLRVLSEIGMDFLDASREVLRAAGRMARQPAGWLTRHGPGHRTFHHFTLTPATGDHFDWATTGRFGRRQPATADLTERRIGNREDWGTLRLSQMLNPVHFLSYRSAVDSTTASATSATDALTDGQADPDTPVASATSLRSRAHRPRHRAETADHADLHRRQLSSPRLATPVLGDRVRPHMQPITFTLAGRWRRSPHQASPSRTPKRSRPWS